MARQDALVRLAKTLLACREDQHKKRADELRSLRDFRAADSAGDSADLAFEAGSDEMASRLVEFNDRELSQIDRALTRCQRSTYGICESCQKRIPLARLNARPYTPFCINCEREKEGHPNGFARRSRGNWAHVFDAQTFMQTLMQDQRLDLAKLEMSLSGNRRG
jgi:DnaK suppressor protein